MLTQEKKISGFLRLLPPAKIAIIAITEVLQHCNSLAPEGFRTARLVLDIGKAIEMEHHFQTAKKEDVFVPKFQTDIPYFAHDAYLQLHKRRLAVKLAQEGKENWMPEWTQAIRARVGGLVMDSLMKSAKIIRTKKTPDGESVTEEQSAFVNTYRYERGSKIGVVQVNPYIMDKLGKEPLKDTLHARHMPMLVQPKSWLAHNNGGYIYSRSGSYSEDHAPRLTRCFSECHAAEGVE